MNLRSQSVKDLVPSMDKTKTKRFQWMVVLIFFATLLSILFYMEGKMEVYEKELAFNYRDYYLKPFHYMLDPFTYVGLKDGVPITELSPPDPYYKLSYEELLVTRFIDYYIWSLGGSREVDATFMKLRFEMTVPSFAGYIRNRLYYRLDRDELDINPIILRPPNIPTSTDIQTSEAQEPEKLIWNVIPYCTDPILEDSLHELGNRLGFLYVRVNYKNYRFVDAKQERDLTKIISSVPVKAAYLNEHSYLNFTRYNLRNPVRISILCDPIQRKLRHFYTERENMKHWSKDVKISDDSDPRWWSMTLDKCMSTNYLECQYGEITNVKQFKNNNVLPEWSPRRVEWTLPQFCDQTRCAQLGKQSDADHVRDVVQSEYAVVGTMEDLEETLDLLEAKVPQFFKGIKDIYKSKLEKSSSSPAWPTYDVSKELKTEMETKFAPEVDFYRFVAQRLHEESSKVKDR